MTRISPFFLSFFKLWLSSVFSAIGFLGRMLLLDRCFYIQKRIRAVLSHPYWLEEMFMKQDGRCRGCWEFLHTFIHILISDNLAWAVKVTRGAVLTFHLFSSSSVCVCSSCRASGLQTCQTAPVWLSTTSTDWWLLAAPGLCASLSLCVFTSQCRLWLLAFVCCSELVVLVVCVHCENVSVCVCRSHLVCTCQDLLLGLWSLPAWQEFLSSLLPTCSSF